MNKDVKQLWIEALESGNYNQGRNKLRQGDSYCCLGVLCKLAVKAGVTVEAKNTKLHLRTSIYNYSGENEELPWEVIEWAGLEDANPCINKEYFLDRQELTLAELNDGGRSFIEIAAIIRENL